LANGVARFIDVPEYFWLFDGEKKKEKAGSEVKHDFHFKVFFSPNFQTR
jgi:hypothetical protein